MISLIFASALSITSLCPDYGNLAQTIMTVRQSGTPMSTVMSSISNGPASKAAKIMVTMAYSQPMYVVQENKDNAISEFRNKVELVCYNKGVGPSGNGK